MQTLSQSIKQYLEMCKYERNLSADTLKAYRIDLRQFLEFTKRGVDEAMAAGEKPGLRVIRGVELSAKEHHNFHILGYEFPAGDTELARLCEKLRAGRDDRKYKIVDFLHEKGVEIDLAEVEALAGGEVIARPHFAQVLVRHGYVSSNREVFDRYLDTEEFRKKVARFKADARSCVEAIKSAGGKVSLAHPYQMGLPSDELEVLVKQLKDWGLDAIECFYPQYTPEQQQFYFHLAEKCCLHQTGGGPQCPPPFFAGREVTFFHFAHIIKGRGYCFWLLYVVS